MDLAHTDFVSDFGLDLHEEYGWLLARKGIDPNQHPAYVLRLKVLIRIWIDPKEQMDQGTLIELGTLFELSWGKASQVWVDSSVWIGYGFGYGSGSSDIRGRFQPGCYTFLDSLGAAPRYPDSQLA